jgi:hypothetical protein
MGLAKAGKRLFVTMRLIRAQFAADPTADPA